MNFPRWIFSTKHTIINFFYTPCSKFPRGREIDVNFFPRISIIKRIFRATIIDHRRVMNRDRGKFETRRIITGVSGGPAESSRILCFMRFG